MDFGRNKKRSLSLKMKIFLFLSFLAAGFQRLASKYSLKPTLEKLALKWLLITAVSLKQLVSNASNGKKIAWEWWLLIPAVSLVPAEVAERA